MSLKIPMQLMTLKLCSKTKVTYGVTKIWDNNEIYISIRGSNLMATTELKTGLTQTLLSASSYAKI